MDRKQKVFAMKTKKNRGRPAIPVARGRPLSLRMLPDELAEFRRAAGRNNETLSGWIRRTLIEAARRLNT